MGGRGWRGRGGKREIGRWEIKQNNEGKELSRKEDSEEEEEEEER